MPRHVAGLTYGPPQHGPSTRAGRAGDVGAYGAEPRPIAPCVSSLLIQLFFRDARRRSASFPHAQAAAG
jgi:hypothetical protein